MNIVRLQGQSAFQQGTYYEYDKDSTPIGEGGMGVLYLGARVHQATGVRTPVVVKAIRDEINTQAHLIQRAMREASVQIDNENLIRMYDFVSNYETSPYTGVPYIRYYIVMEYLFGVSLDRVLEGQNSVNDQEIPLANEIISLYSTDRTSLCVMLMKNLLSGALALHNAGFIHRDLDPSNVMITREGKIKIIDFGICKQINGGNTQQPLTAAGSFMGKVQYAAPELILGAVKDQNVTTDIYALGVILFQFYTGHAPFVGVSDQEIMQAHLKGKLPYKEISDKEVQRIVRKATAVRQSDRYQSAAEFIVDMDRLQNRTKIPAPTPVKETGEVHVPTWLYFLVGGLGAALGILLSLFVF